MIRRFAAVSLIGLVVWMVGSVQQVNDQNRVILDRIEAEQKRQVATIRRVLRQAKLAEDAATRAGRVPERTLAEVTEALELLAGPDVVEEAIRGLEIPEGSPGPAGPPGPAGATTTSPGPAVSTTTSPATTTTSTTTTRCLVDLGLVRLGCPMA